MKKKSMIDWTNAVVSFWFGCTKVSSGCLRCYAADEAKRFKQLGQWGVAAPRRLSLGAMQKVRSLDRSALRARADGAKVMATVFVNSRADFFEDRIDLVLPRKLAWKAMRESPNLDFLLLTKRPENIQRYLPDDFGRSYGHLHLGTTVESSEFIHRIEKLRAVSDWGGYRWVSNEPCLDNVIKCVAEGGLDGIGWWIYGGESSLSKQFRKDDDAWARDAKNRCSEEGIAFFYKQNSGLRRALRKSLDGKVFHGYPERFLR